MVNCHVKAIKHVHVFFHICANHSKRGAFLYACTCFTCFVVSLTSPKRGLFGLRLIHFICSEYGIVLYVYTHTQYVSEVLTFLLVTRNHFDSAMFNPIQTGLFWTFSDRGGGFGSPPYVTSRIFKQSS